MASNINQIDKNALVYVKEIGEGGFANVYEMTWKSPNGPVNVAAKKLRRKDRHELEVLSELEHPNIVKIIGVVDEAMDFMLILELCTGGSLRSYLRARNGRRLSIIQFFDWAEQSARPLEYLREKKWIHKDVKSDNYMVTSQNKLKLGDFGIAKNIDQTVGNATDTASYRWMAPELLLKGILSPKYDIFALAVVLWELWTGRYPWEGLEIQVIAWKVCNENERLPIPEDCPEPIKDLLRLCWQADWKLRPDIIQVLKVITSTAAVHLQSASATALHPLTAVSEARQREIIAGPWNMVKEFGMQDGPGKLKMAYHMTLGANGDVVIADNAASQIKIYSLEGEYKSSILTHSKPWQIAVSSNNTCFITNYTKIIKMYELDGKYEGSWESSCPNGSSYAPWLYGLAIDHTGDLLLGDCINRNIHTHRQDGVHVASINVGIEPRYIAVTSQGTIVIAQRHTTPQVISTTGEVLYTLKHPVHNSQWKPWSVYCHAGIIFVSTPIDGKFRLLCHSETGKYLGSMPIPLAYPICRGIAITSDSNTLLVCDLASVKVFTQP